MTHMPKAVRKTEDGVVFASANLTVKTVNNTPIAEKDQAVATLAASLIAHFEAAGINPDPDIWQLVSDAELNRALGQYVFNVLNQRREVLKVWMSKILAANAS